jgi:hypothetical protein
VDERRKTRIRRRDLLIAVSASGVAAAMGAPAINPSSDAAGRRNKRKAQYQANSPEVQAFYRVNRYPAKS